MTSGSRPRMTCGQNCIQAWKLCEKVSISNLTILLMLSNSVVMTKEFFIWLTLVKEIPLTFITDGTDLVTVLTPTTVTLDGRLAPTLSVWWKPLMHTKHRNAKNAATGGSQGQKLKFHPKQINEKIKNCSSVFIKVLLKWRNYLNQRRNSTDSSRKTNYITTDSHFPSFPMFSYSYSRHEQ